jgi:hypothetical protein
MPDDDAPDEVPEAMADGKPAGSRRAGGEKIHFWIDCPWLCGGRAHWCAARVRRRYGCLSAVPAGGAGARRRPRAVMS